MWIRATTQSIVNCTWDDGDSFERSQDTERPQGRQIAQIDAHRHVPDRTRARAKAKASTSAATRDMGHPTKALSSCIKHAHRQQLRSPKKQGGGGGEEQEEEKKNHS